LASDDRRLNTQAGKNKPLNTFTEALEAFRTAMYYRFFALNRDVFAAYKASLGFIWA
jgi:hypothetical protein